MTLRAFLIGLALVAGLGLFEPWVWFAKGWGVMSATSFPASAVLVLVLLTVGLNLLIKLVRRGWALAQSELMLIWSMLIVAATFTGDGIARFWYSLMAAPAYMARRTDVPWEEGGSLTHAPDGLVLSKNPLSRAAEAYYQGGMERVPWDRWVGPLLHWAVFFVLLYLAVFFLMAVLRRQWVERERLMFPLARVPMEFTEGARERRWLPAIFSRKGFLVGLAFAVAFRLMRALPVIFGAQSAMALSLPFADILQGTPLEPMGFKNFEFWPVALGFAFLVPADVSLSVWFFYFFARVEFQACHELGFSDLAWPLLTWQQAGAYIAFTLIILFMARRHLLAVARAALGWGDEDDSGEPVHYRTAAWGLVLSVVGCLAWYLYHGMNWHAAVAVFALIMCWYIVYARVVAQAGLYVARTVWRLPEVVHGLSGGRALSPAGAVIANMQDALLVVGGTVFLAPMAINAYRIGEVYRKKRRHLLVPVLMVAFLVAAVCGTWSLLNVAYSEGAANFQATWAQSAFPRSRMDYAHRIITQPTLSARAYPAALALGMGLMSFLMFMRARFYWWPVHAIGLLSCSSWHADRLWLPFLLGWMCKVGIMKFAGGGWLRQARYFFIALIIVEMTADGLSTIVRALTGGAVPAF